MYANSVGSGVTVQMRRLTWAFAGRLCGKYHNLMGWCNYLAAQGLTDEQCRTRQTVIPSDWIFNSHQTYIMDCFSWILFLEQYHLNLYMHYFINLSILLKYLQFQSSNVRFSSNLRRWRRNIWQKKMSNPDFILLNIKNMFIVILHLYPTPYHVRRQFLLRLVRWKFLLGMQEIYM